MASFYNTMKVFNPEGRIFQMEYAFKAIQQFGQTSIAIKGKDSVVVCCAKKVPDKLIVPDSVTNIFSISDDCGAIIVGNMKDARYIVTLLSQQAKDFKMKFSYWVGQSSESEFEVKQVHSKIYVKSRVNRECQTLETFW